MEETSHIFNPGSPISDPDDDLLGRKDFAAGVAGSLSGWTGKDSLVLAISGKWGDGKSSTKNLILKALDDVGEKKPEVVEFTPWQWAAQDQLFDSFFSEVGTAIGRIDSSAKTRKRLRAWRSYAEILKAGHQVTSGVGRLILVMLAIPPSLILIFGEPSNPSALGVIFLTLIIIASFLEKGLSAIANIAEGYSKGLSAKLKLTTGTVTDRKEELRNFLLEQRQPVLVVMDDIDRLSNEEIRAVFQLIKANADFPNLIYLLLFQRDIVERSLGETFHGDGRGYLEKVAQVQIDLPRIERSRVEKVLFEKLDKIFESPDAKNQFDQKRWTDLFLSGMRVYFQNLRDVYRFLSTLEFHISLFRQRPTLDINILDFIGLEVLRLFEPDVFNRLPTAKSTLTGIIDDGSVIPRGDEYDQSVMDTILDNASKDHKAEVTGILKFLFPICEPLTNMKRQIDAEMARSQRIGYPEFFDRYFLLAIRAEDISEGEFQSFYSAAGNREKFVELFHGFKERGLAKALLSRLDDFKAEIPLDIAAEFLGALFDISMSLDAKSEFGVFDISEKDHIRRTIFLYLLREPDPEKREQMFLEAIESTEALYMPTVLIMYDVQESRTHGSEALIRPESFDDFKSLAVSRIKKAAEKNRLFNQPELSFLLYWWREWEGPEGPRKYVSDCLTSQKAAIKFLIATRSPADSSAGGRYWHIYPNHIERYTTFETISEIIGSLDRDALSRDEKLAVIAFENSKTAHEKGLNENDGAYNVFEKDYDADGNLVSK